MDKILIFGISGFTGRHFQQYIINNKLENKYHFIGVDLNSSEKIQLDCRQCDLADVNELSELIKTEAPDYIINFAGISHSDDIELVININTNICRTVCDSIVKYDIKLKKLLLIGSAAEYGSNQVLPLSESSSLNPASIYGLSKVWQTYQAKYFRNCYNLKISLARTFNISACDLPDKFSLGSFVEQIKNLPSNGTLAVGNINSMRDFVEISDVVDAYWKILMNEKDDFIFNVCSGYSILISDIITHLIKVSGKNIQVIVDPDRYYKGDIADSYGDNKKIKQITGWCPRVDILQSLENYFVSKQTN
jgi:GDP-4-dehydro-6-deoxy-D-mannose reductase